MLCSNCGKNEANVRYTRIINGEKQNLHYVKIVQKNGVRRY